MSADAVRERQVKEYQERLRQQEHAKALAKASGNKTGEINRTHRVVRFGQTFTSTYYEEEEAYKFKHQRLDGLITEGYIPVNFLSCVTVDGGQTIYMETRPGGDMGGPEFRFAHQTQKNVIGDWSNEIDTLWSKVMGYFEKKGCMTEGALDYLDADPFVLFGVDDPVTQKGLYKLRGDPGRGLESADALICEGATPTQMDWFVYLCGPDEDPYEYEDLEWVIEAFAESELPAPWISYVGVGSVVCFTNTSSGVMSWKHPSYEYFKSLLVYCQQAQAAEVAKLRVHRLLWNFVTYQANADAECDPLISPANVRALGQIFGGIDVSTESMLVRPLKHALKYFAHRFRTNKEIFREDVLEVVETIHQEQEKHAVMEATWRETLQQMDVDVNALSDG